MTVRTKIWSRLRAEEREPYLDRARKIVYPDLRTAYVEDLMMVQTMAIALFKCSVLMDKGGGRHQEDTKYIKSILEEV